MQGSIVKVSGPLIVAENMSDVKMYDVVKVGEQERRCPSSLLPVLSAVFSTAFSVRLKK